MLRVAVVLVLHVSAPVVLAGERLAALARPGTPGLGTVVLARLVVLVVDVPVQMGFGAEAPVTVGVGALVWSLMVPLVMAVGYV